MTNTLHRYGNEKSLHNDFIVFAIPCRGHNDQGAVPKLKRFLQLARKYKPVNLGDGSHGGIYRPSKELNPTAHWSRASDPDFDTVIEGVSDPTTVAAVFDNIEAVEGFVDELRKEDLGLSINISALIERAQECCEETGLARHSVEYSLGFMGRTDRLADRQVLELSTMCGHGMISFNFARKMIDWVREGRRTPEEACMYFSRFCSCGIFNPTRAREILEEARYGNS
ncbi:MAG: hypothetical protein L0226_16480 [Acidobacteria bacterium]|nr:hypothetical protein [Acidobacteriota bacterium]